MIIFLKQVLNGLAAGSIYALVALGYTMIYGILGIINFAQGEIYMAGAITAVILLSTTSMGFIPAFILGLLVTAILGFLMELGVFRPLRGTNPLIPLIAAIGISIFLRNLARLKFIFGPNKRPFPIDFDFNPISIQFLGKKIPAVGKGSVDLFHHIPFEIPAMDVYILLTTALLMIALTLFIKRTKYGKAIVASASDREAASLMGINVNYMISLTFVIGSVLSGVAGIMMAIYYSTYPDMGMLPGLKAFASAILGGVGSIPGAILGGLVIGVAENLGAAYIHSGLKDAIAFIIMILVLIFMPYGIMGKKE